MTLTPIADPVALRHATLDAIRANPEEWTQHQYRCGTGMCYAGQAAQLAGGAFPYPDTDTNLDTVGDDLFVQHREIVIAPDGERHTIHSFARRALGLTIQQASVVFHEDNTLDRLANLITAIDAGRDVYPGGFDDTDPDDVQTEPRMSTGND